MPKAERDGVPLNWRSDGDKNSPALLLLNSLGTEMAMWERAIPHLASHFRVLRMDARGHGGSGVPPGDYTILQMARDALAVLDAAGTREAHVCGLSMGGMIALELALLTPSRIGKVVACNTSAKVAPAPWQARAATVRAKGMAAIVDAVMERFFSERFRKRNPDTVAGARSTFLATSPEGYAACCMAISELDMLQRLSDLVAPTLVINGTLDAATPPHDHGDLIAAAVSGAQTINLDAGHLSVLEQPEAFTSAVSGFLRK